MTVAKVTPGKALTSEAASFRVLTGAPVTDDSATISDANFPPGAALISGGWKSLIVRVALTGGATPTCKVQPLMRVGDGWAAMEKSYVLSDGWGYVFESMGRDVYLRVESIAGAPTGIELLVGGFEAFRADQPRRD